MFNSAALMALFRLDCLCDPYPRSWDAIIFDVGCNRGWVSFDLCLYDATMVHGRDNSDETIDTALFLFGCLRYIGPHVVA